MSNSDDKHDLSVRNTAPDSHGRSGAKERAPHQADLGAEPRRSGDLRVQSFTRTALIEVLRLARPGPFGRIGFIRCPEMYSVAMMMLCSPSATAAE
jgi:hypothetical protein